MTEENIKLFDSELKVMDVLWKDGDVPAKYVADTLNREVGWNKNTTYTLISGVSIKARLNERNRDLCAMRL